MHAALPCPNSDAGMPPWTAAFDTIAPGGDKCILIQIKATARGSSDGGGGTTTLAHKVHQEFPAGQDDEVN